MKPIRIVLADDHPVVRAGIRAFLQGTTDLALVGEAATGEEALALIRQAGPDVAVIDISLPGLSGLEVARTLAENGSDTRLLVLTVHEHGAYVQPLLQAGVRGYLVKRSAAEDLVQAIRTVAAGGFYLDPAIAAKAMPSLADQDEAEGEPLSQREEEVLRLVAQGFSNKEAAARLEISVKTVETYRARAADKLGLRTRVDVVRYGVTRGWLGEIGAD